MTRYTKLDGRRTIGKAEASPSKKRAASVVGESDPTTTTQATAPEDTTSDKPAEEHQPMTQERLLKKAKLLKLKAKKAKTPKASKKFLKRAWDLEAESDKVAEEAQRAHQEARNDSGWGKRQRREEPVESNPWKSMFKEQQSDNTDRSEARRLKRVNERLAKTKCFACRGMGHAAKDCPQALDAQTSQLGAGETSSMTGKETVGICFRCGSTQHTLAKCRRPAPTVGDELPFATCFICSGKGHLSSKCPKNKGRGVYPDGGCCKLCESVEHLAKDCPLSLRRAQAPSGTGHLIVKDQELQGGADEDHFHSLARKRVEVESKQPSTKKDSKKVVAF